jgi:phage terminase small subunit
MNRKLNQRQKRFVKELIKEGTVLKAGVNAGYSLNYAKSDLKEIQEKPEFKKEYDREIEKVYKEAGITRELLALKTLEGLRATKPITFQGEVISYEPDWFMIQRNVEMAHKNLGDFAPDKLDVWLSKKEASEVFEQRLETLKTVLGPSTSKELSSFSGEDTPEKIEEYDTLTPQAVADPVESVKDLKSIKIEE